MGLFDYSSTPQPSGAGYTAGFSPPTQGLLALSQALLAAGQPSRIPVTNAQAFGNAIPGGLLAYRSASDRQNFMNAMQKGDTAGAVKTLVSSSDPDLQKAGLSAITATMIPKWEATKDAMGNPIAYNAVNPSQTMSIGRSPFAALGLDGSPPPGSPMAAGAGAPGTVPSGASSPAGPPGQPALPSGAPGATPPMNAPTTAPAGALGVNAATPQKPGVDYNYLNQAKALSPLAGTMAENMIAGTFMPESSKGENDPNYVAAVAIARRADPTFTPQSLIGRPGMVKNATSGKMYTDMVNLNSVAGHLYDLHAAAPGLNNGTTPLTNWFGNEVATGIGTSDNKGVSNYQAILSRAAPELNKFYVGGEGDKEGRASAGEAFSSSQDPAVITNNVKTQLGLLKSKAGALQSQYDNTMGGAANMKIIQPDAQALMDDLDGKPLTVQQQQMVNAHRQESNLPPKTWDAAHTVGAGTPGQQSSQSPQISKEAALAELRARGVVP